MVRAVSDPNPPGKPQPGTASTADPRGMSGTKAGTKSGVSATASSADPRAAKSDTSGFVSNAGLNKKTGMTSAPTAGTSAGDGGALAKPAAIIVTAHNAAGTLKACLETILGGAAPNELEVVVVCYACSDNSAEIARNFGKQVKVFETKSPSKTAALNLADKSATAFPRFYVDSHALLNIDAIRKVTNILRTSEMVEAAAPAINIDISESSWFVRAYYQIWLQRDRVRYGLMGSGVFAVSEVGHSRFHKFPVVMAEDLYVRLHFHQRNRRTITGCTFKIKAPNRLVDVFHQRVRQRIGVCEIKELFPALLQNENRRGVVRDLLSLMNSVSNIVAMTFSYLPVCIASDLTARVRNLWSWWRPKPKPKRDPNAPRERRSPSDYDVDDDEE